MESIIQQIVYIKKPSPADGFLVYYREIWRRKKVNNMTQRDDWELVKKAVSERNVSLWHRGDDGGRKAIRGRLEVMMP